MTKFRFIQSVVLASLLLITGCYEWVGGYRGPLYHWSHKDVLYFDIKQNKISFSDTSIKIVALFIVKDNDGILEEKDLFSQKSNNYAIPDSLNGKISNKKIQVKVVSHEATIYSIKVTPNDWSKKKFVFGYPINDVENHVEMISEISSIDKEVNK